MHTVKWNLVDKDKAGVIYTGFEGKGNDTVNGSWSKQCNHLSGALGVGEAALLIKKFQLKERRFLFPFVVLTLAMCIAMVHMHIS